VSSAKFRYRTRTEFGAFLDEINAENGGCPVLRMKAGIGHAACLRLSVDRHTGQIMRAAEG
jgi:hypothetical protein